ncbi:hypothetical protein SAMN05216516_11429 [Izhakiella capsodis]|uniref:Uncharacterized protein n=1 Tax=Izhakiella capsodis TaxID=1367852 RepID=A0A1I5B2D5_9GAMM|nr:hypothetical protein SAMN05216516_11429 [Izhakiella capsodis]
MRWLYLSFLIVIQALKAPQLSILAITTSAGNQTPDKTLHNALGLCTLMGDRISRWRAAH